MEETKELFESNTVFDDVFRTMLERIPEIMIPLINEVFSTNYPEDEPITQLKNEHFTKSGVSITDCVLGIREKHYHLECQSNPDRTIALRIIEHDMALALQTVKEVTLLEGSEHDYEMSFPHSCVLYLRHNSKTKDKAYVRILFQDNTSHIYSIPIVKAQEYTKDEIFEKNLLALIPYYFMRYEHSLPELCRNEENSLPLLEELSDIRSRLERTVGEEKGLIYAELISHIKKIDDHIFRNQPETRKRMEEITMGGQVYETLTDQAVKRGAHQQLLTMIDNMVNAKLCSFEKACEIAEITPEEYTSIKDALGLFQEPDKGIADMETGRELPLEEAFQKVTALREQHRK